MTEKEVVRAMAEAIAHEREFFKQTRRGHPQTLTRRLNNPGGLSYFFDRSSGAPYPTACGIVEFPDVYTGWSAIETVIHANVMKRGLSLREFFKGKKGSYGGFVSRSVEHPDELALAVVSRLSKTLRVELSLDSRLESTQWTK